MKLFSSVVLAVAAIAACADANAHDKKTRAQSHQGKQHPEGKTKKGKLRASPLLEPKVDASVGSGDFVVVRINTKDAVPTLSRKQLSDKVFGTDGDKENLKSQYAGCSHGKFQVHPATGGEIVDGATEVDLTHMASAGVDCQTLADEAEKVLNVRWGTNDWTEIIDYMVFVCPPGTSSCDDTAWTAYATGGHRSYFNNNEILSTKMQVHEVGHNLWLDHSNENGEFYGDNTGMMGTSHYEDEGAYAKVCFNPAKSWQLGWYRDKSITVDPSTEYIGRIVGVNNYDKVTGNDKVILKVPGAGVKDYFIGFNHADGFNEGTWEAANQVTVVEQEVPPGNDWTGELYSSLKAKLGPGEVYTTSNGVVIKVMKVVTTPNTGYAMVQICAVNSCSITPTCEDEAGWMDNDGYVCTQWTGMECSTVGDGEQDVSMTANQACCICGGGTLPSGSDESQNPNPQPQNPTSSSDDTGNSAGFDDEGCTNHEEWVDSCDNGCDIYEANPDDCVHYSHEIGTDGMSPGEACCVCHGITGCTNHEEWVDSVDDGCDIYEANPDDCVRYSDEIGTDGMSPGEACCVCHGTSGSVNPSFPYETSGSVDPSYSYETSGSVDPSYSYETSGSVDPSYRNGE